MGTPRYNNQDQSGNVGQTIDDLTYRLPVPKTNANPTHAYINTAFSFLKGDDHGPYKYYEDTKDEVDIPLPEQQGSGSKEVTDLNIWREKVDDYDTLSTRSETLTWKERLKSTQALKIFLLVSLTLLVIGALVIAILYIFVLQAKPPPELIPGLQFSGTAVIDLPWRPSLYDTNSQQYKSISEEFVENIDSIIGGSNFSAFYSQTRVDRLSPGSIIIHFKIFYVEPPVGDNVSWQNLPQEDKLEVYLQKELGVRYTQGLLNWPVQNVNLTATNAPPGPTTALPIFTTPTLPRTTPEPVTCLDLTDSNCENGQYSKTGFPNAYGHKDFSDIGNGLDRLLNVNEHGCYAHTKVFGCLSIYPECTASGHLISPCRSFCTVFVESCRFPIRCDSFIDDDDPETCVLPPDYEPEYKSIPANPCQGRFWCGNNKCLQNNLECNDVDDCGDMSDELQCENSPESQIDCNFENGNMCGYTPDSSNHFDWTVQVESATSAGTGPATDHTKRDGTGSYLLADASGQYWGDTAWVKSPKVDLTTSHCLRFYYHMFGEHVRTLKVFLQSDGKNMTEVWLRGHDQSNSWKYGWVTLETGSHIVIFEAVRGESFRGDIAIDDITLRPGACPSTSQKCGSGEYSCSNGNCVPSESVCNGKDDCLDYTDEQGCTCNRNQFKCKMGMCIPQFRRCDETEDCPDSSDEQDCTCPQGQIQCQEPEEEKCIMSEWLCDGMEDCAGGDDEKDCDLCWAAEWQCRDLTCIDASQQCNGVPDCPDGSDETLCIRQTEDQIVGLYVGNAWHNLCAENYDDSLDNDICAALGKGPAILRSAVPTAGSNSYIRVATNFAGSSLLGKFERVSSCASNLGIALECSDPICGKTTLNIPASFIVNGEVATPGRWPWVAGVLINFSLKCGGTLISQSHVVTAAHCVEENANPNNYQVLLGSIYTSKEDSNRRTVQVKKIRRHEDYQYFYWGNDIAVLTLSEAVTYSDYIRPLCLPEEKDKEEFPLSSLCYTAGWGYLNYTEGQTVDTMREGKVRILSTEVCKKGHPNYADDMICAGYESGYIANCKGDSGGPLMCADPYGRWKLVGVFSSIPKGCSVPQNPPLYMRVQHYRKWIKNGLECAFVCTNSKCLVDAVLVCNGQDDCGDNSDETLSCKPSISCQFENDYLCGYKNVQDLQFSKWTRERISGTVNHGPTVDHTLGNTKGSFLFAGKNRAVIMAPPYSKSRAHCLQFWYHIFGKEVGRFLVWSIASDSSGSLTYDSIVANRKIEVDFSTPSNDDNQDFWVQKSFDVPAGDFVFGFEAKTISTQSNSYPFISVDDVELIEGTCSSIGCNNGESPCNKRGCFKRERKCDYIPDCPEDNADESSCSVVIYQCNFEVYGNCRFEQSRNDNLDWKVLSPGPTPFNSPAEDHTTGSSSGFFAYFPTHVGQPGHRAMLLLPVYDQNSENCLVFYFTMASTGALSVSFETDRDGLVEAFRRRNYNSPGWLKMELPIFPLVHTIYISGTIGSTTSIPTTNYIAVDDIRLTSTKCTNPECRPDQGRCNNGDCISMTHFCDGGFDCDDYEDEIGCDCRPGEVRCNGICRDRGQVCFGLHECGDVTNLNCSCDSGSYKCGDGTCRPGNTWCDGTDNCPGGTDELEGCVCRDEQFTCDNEKCILGIFYCDGNPNCADGSDEPEGCTCNSKWRFLCDNNRCVSQSLVCNTENNCADFSDERNCGPCADDQFECTSIGMCISKSLRCDGVIHCPAAEDETEDCIAMPCGDDRFKCAAGHCIPQRSLCNSIDDCGDASDEVDCICPEGQSKCSNGLCIQTRFFCDYEVDCDDQSDETKCSCAPGDFKCASGRCIKSGLKCNGYDDCLDNSDEDSCDIVQSCKPGEFTCADQSGCIPTSLICDRYSDCRDGSDETGCGSCFENFMCSNNYCVPRSSRCNGISECSDNSDEVACFFLGTENELTDVLLKRGTDEDNPVPVCATNWLSDWDEMACKKMGHGVLLLSDTATVVTNQYFVVEAGASGEYTHAFLEYSDSCPDNKVVKLQCAKRECGIRLNPQPASFIVGGDTAAVGAWPWMVAIYYLNEFICGGVLIDKEWVLSASHCFFLNQFGVPVRAHYVSVKVGTNELTQTSAPAQKILVSEIIPHPNFYTNEFQFRYNDLAMLKLAQPVDVGDFIRPICLPDPVDPEPPNKVCFATGWGYTNPSGRTVTNLREVHMHLWTDAACQQPHLWNENINSTMHLCAGYTNGKLTTCFGDSGGPLVCQDKNAAAHWSLDGTVSMGSQNCAVDRPNVFAKIKNYTPWIKEIIFNN